LYSAHNEPQYAAYDVKLARGLNEIRGKAQQHPDSNTYFNGKYIGRSLTKSCENGRTRDRYKLNDQDRQDQLRRF
jgi:hypothetical protein